MARKLDPRLTAAKLNAIADYTANKGIVIYGRAEFDYEVGTYYKSPRHGVVFARPTADGWKFAYHVNDIPLTEGYINSQMRNPR